MATPLHVILEEIREPTRDGVARYTEELTRALLGTRPDGCEVIGFVAAAAEPEIEALRERIPGLVRVETSRLSRRQLSAAWQHGVTRAIGTSGMLHAPSLLAPLRRRRSSVDQTVVTIHDATALTDPAGLDDGRTAGWYGNMIARAEKYADGVVVPSHAVADALAEHTSLGDRVRVIPGGATARPIPDDVEERAARLGLPDRYLVTPASLGPGQGLRELLAAIAPLDIALLLTGVAASDADELPQAIATLDIREGRVRALEDLSADDLTVVEARAALHVHPGRQAGFGFSTLDAMSLGTPVVVSDDAALVELTDGAAEVVARDGDDPSHLRDAISGLLEDGARAARLAVAARDRSRAFSWRDSAEKVWQLHADL